MYFHFGALFLLGSVSLSTALPPCMCTRNLKPVCGSDGRTYNNECLLHCAQVTDPELFLERTGRCDGTSLGPPRDIRQAPFDCICTLEYLPFCGTDGKTYPNRCSLNCAKRSTPVDIAYPGQCRKKREVNRDTQPPTKCTCPRYIASVCGTDGKTYKNPCYLNCSKQKDEDLDVLYIGDCGPNVKVMECDGCTRKVKPVCGTDGYTYRNPCMLNCLRENDEDLHIDYEGPCDSSFAIVDSLSCADCTRVLKPVCGTNGKTYRNPCFLNCTQDNDDLRIDYQGRCGGRV